MNFELSTAEIADALDGTERLPGLQGSAKAIMMSQVLQYVQGNVAETIDDRVAALLQAAGLLQITYDDEGNILTLNVPNNVIGQYVADGSSSVADFVGIPPTYRDLIIVANGRTTAAAYWDAVNLTVNGLTTGIYDRQRKFSRSGSTTGADGSTSQSAFDLGCLNGDSVVSVKAGSGRFEIPDYAGTAFHKTILGHARVDDTSGHTGWDITMTGSIRNSAAVDRITITTGGLMRPGTKITLYGR